MDRLKISELLHHFIAIPSVSTEKAHIGDMQRAVDFLSSHLRPLGFRISVQNKQGAHPIMLAYRKGKPNHKTIGIYGHYDVQPADPIDAWDSPPFTLTNRDGKMFGRGIADNKGHIIQNIAAIAQLIEENKLKSSILFILEGEEEVGSENFADLITRETETVGKCDVFYVTDVGMHQKYIPQIFYALRGLVYCELQLSTGTRDLHSGVYGNRVKNAAQVAMYILNTMKDVRNGKLLIEGITKDVRHISTKERKLLETIRRTDAEEKNETGAYDLMSLDKQNPSLSSKIYPSLDVHGIQSGFTQEGQKTIIPWNATVKFSIRLVEYQKPDVILHRLKQHITKYMPGGVKYSIKILSSDHPFYTELTNPYVKKTAEALEHVFGHKTLFNRSGGSIPAAELFQRLFHKPVILTGFTLPNDHIHSPNENFDEEMFWKGIEALKLIYQA